MADESANYDVSIFADIDLGSTPTGIPGYLDVLNVGGAVGSTTYYVMRGLDPDCIEVTYRLWIVADQPDTDGSQYTGIKCGANPLEDIVVVKKIVS